MFFFLNCFLVESLAEVVVEFYLICRKLEGFVDTCVYLDFFEME